MDMLRIAMIMNLESLLTGGTLGEGISFSCPVQNLIGKSHYNNPSIKEIHMENNCHYDQHFRKALV